MAEAMRETFFRTPAGLAVATWTASSRVDIASYCGRLRQFDKFETSAGSMATITGQLDSFLLGGFCFRRCARPTDVQECSYGGDAFCLSENNLSDAQQ